MSTQSKRITVTVIALVAFVALISGLFVSQYFFSKPRFDRDQFHGTLLNQPRDVNTFELVGIDKKAFNNASLNGQWTMMFFGFTNCGYLCPTTMAELGKFYKVLEQKGAKTMPTIVMVSIDPKRDSQEKLGKYVKAFDPHFYGARGDKKSIQAMTKEFGIAYAKVALKGSDDAENYDIEHTGTVLLFNPQGELTAFFTSPQQAENLSEDYLMLTS
jgi:protein SCO1